MNQEEGGWWIDIHWMHCAVTKGEMQGNITEAMQCKLMIIVQILAGYVWHSHWWTMKESSGVGTLAICRSLIHHDGLS